MDVSKFNGKLNKLDGKTYVIEEIVNPANGVYEAELSHDNVDISTLNIYTGSKLTGDKINTYITSTPSLTPWKTIISIYSNINQLYISYETTGDQVEAEDINNLQDAVINTQENLNSLSDNFDSYKASTETNLSNRYTKDQVFTKDEILQKINDLIGVAPQMLDTFAEVAKALNEDPNFATTIMNLLALKVNSDSVYSKDEINNILVSLGNGDMSKSIYDTNNDGIVDNADKLDGKHASDFMKKGPITWNDLEGV